MKTRILLADDHALTREGMRRLLQTDNSMEVVAEAKNGQEALDLTGSTQPNVVIMDISMPHVNGIQATTEIRKRYPHVLVLAQSGHANHAYITAMLDAGAQGYILKQHIWDDLLKAVHTVVAGQSFLGTEVSDTLDPSTLEHVAAVVTNSQST
ncbi:response regulator transcription factor [Planctomycetota bacterium]